MGEDTEMIQRYMAGLHRLLRNPYRTNVENRVSS